ncbi:MAG: hypothetical protein IKW90_09200 [Lachnospiraceae bacterium]|nr:hypothetical protein [Lachnospiraceae bacterium]
MTEKEKRIAEMREEGLLFSEIGENSVSLPHPVRVYMQGTRKRLRELRRQDFPWICLYP